MKKYILTIVCWITCSLAFTQISCSPSRSSDDTNTNNTSEPGDETTSAPQFNGSFVQEYLVASWSNERCDQEMEMLKEAGIEYLIYAPALSVNESGITTTNYPSSLTTKDKQNNTLEKCLRSAQKKGVKIFIGLNFNDRWWRGDYDTNWLVGQMEIGNRVADELVALYKEKYGETMYGWYWVWEVDNLNWRTTERKDALVKALNTNLDHLSKISPGMPLMLSPFMNYKVGGGAEEYGKLWEYIFSKTNFRAGDIFVPQDCVGAGGLTLELVHEWFPKLKQAANSKPGLLFWGNVETFDQRFWVTAPLARVQKQLEIVNGYVSNMICFAYSHYNSPYVVNEGYHRAYVQYRKNGKLPSVAVPQKVTSVSAQKTAQGMEVKWVPGSLDNVAGYSIYRYGELVGRVQLLNGKSSTLFLDKEQSVVNDAYEVASYNVLGDESGKVKAK